MGQLSSVQDAVGMRHFLYNDTFAPIKETITGLYTKELERTYTNTGMKGRILSLNIGNELNFSYDYDEYGRLNKISTLAGDFNYTYLANSNIIEQISRPNNITTIWSYEPHRDVITQISNGNICGWPRKLDNLTWCKMPVKLTRRGRAFYEKVV